jgi:hypothetical protein
LVELTSFNIFISMKTLILTLIVAAAIALTSCGGATESTVSTADSTQTVDTVCVDTICSDSVYIDSLAN